METRMRLGELDGGEIRGVVGPVDGAHDAEVVVEGNHHAGQRGEGQAIIARDARGLAR